MRRARPERRYLRPYGSEHEVERAKKKVLVVVEKALKTLKVAV